MNEMNITRKNKTRRARMMIEQRRQSSDDRGMSDIGLQRYESDKTKKSLFEHKLGERKKRGGIRSSIRLIAQTNQSSPFRRPRDPPVLGLSVRSR